MNDEIRNTSFYRTGEWCVLTEKEKTFMSKNPNKKQGKNKLVFTIMKFHEKTLLYCT